jgi:hypothetical protein
MNYNKSSISKYERTVNGGSAYPLTEFMTSASHNFEKGNNDAAIYGGGYADTLDRMKKYSVPMCLVYDVTANESTAYKAKSEAGVLGEDIFEKLFSVIQRK